MRGRQNWSRYLLVLFMLIVGGSRLYSAVSHELLEDELHTYFFATRYPVVSQLVSPSDDRPPGFYLLIKGLLSISDEMVFLRLMSVAVSVVIAWLNYKLFEPFGSAYAKVGLVLGAFLPMFYFHSWQARDYVYLQLLATLGMVVVGRLLLVEAKSKQAVGSAIKLAGLGVVMSLGELMNYAFGVFLVAFLGSGAIYFLVYEKRSLKYTIARLLPLGAALLPVGIWVLMYLKQQSGYVLGTTAWIPSVSVRAVANLFLIFFGASYDFPGMAEVKYQGQLIFVVGVGLLGFSWLAVRKAGLKLREKRLVVFSLILIGVYFLSILGAGLVMKRSFFLPKMFVVLATPMLILQAVLIVNLIEKIVKKSKRALVYGLLGVCFAGVMSCQMVWVNKGYAYKWISTIPDAVDRVYNQGDQIVFVPHYRLNFFYYFWRKRNIEPDYFFLQEQLISLVFGHSQELPAHCDECEVILVINKDIKKDERVVADETATYADLRQKLVDICGSELVLIHEDWFQTVETCEGY